jgi:hypothetical protein
MSMMKLRHRLNCINKRKKRKPLLLEKYNNSQNKVIKTVNLKSHMRTLISKPLEKIVMYQEIYFNII